MKDPVLAQQIEAAGAFIADWNALFERAAGARQAGPAAPGDAAAEFLAVRNALVQRYPELMTALEIPVHSDDEVMQLLGRLNSLAAAVQMPEPHWKKLIEVQGHAEVQLRGMLGALEGRRRRPRDAAQAAHPPAPGAGIVAAQTACPRGGHSGPVHRVEGGGGVSAGGNRAFRAQGPAHGKEGPQ